jgi:hypothetical protein
MNRPLYFTNPSKATMPHIMTGELGFIDTPRQGNRRPIGVTWCADNGAFSDKFNEKQWWTWLSNQTADADQCLFAVAPDVMLDPDATLERSKPYLPKMRALGYPAAYVAQDGQQQSTMPWGDMDALFIGGSTEWKFSDDVRGLVDEAHEHCIHVHLGRVNSKKRYDYARHELGAGSVDGTFIVYGPEINLPRLLKWIRDDQLALDNDGATA